MCFNMVVSIVGSRRSAYVYRNADNEAVPGLEDKRTREFVSECYELPHSPVNDNVDRG